LLQLLAVQEACFCHGVIFLPCCCVLQVFLAEWMGTQVAAKQLLSFQNKAKDEVTKRKANAARVAKHDFSRDDHDSDSDSDTDRWAGSAWLAVGVLLGMCWVCLAARAGRNLFCECVTETPIESMCAATN
jgi:hypothetical protein